MNIGFVETSADGLDENSWIIRAFLFGRYNNGNPRNRGDFIGVLGFAQLHDLDRAAVNIESKGLILFDP